MTTTDPRPDLTKDAVLALCPFCGGEGAPATIRYGQSTVAYQQWSHDTFHYISCISCAANNRGLVGHLSPEDAIAAWNRRAVAPLLDGGEETEGAVEAAAKAIFAARVPALAAAVADPWAEAGQPERRQAFDAARAALAAYAPLIRAHIAQAEQAATERAAQVADNCGPDPMAVFIAAAIRNTEEVRSDDCKHPEVAS